MRVETCLDRPNCIIQQTASVKVLTPSNPGSCQSWFGGDTTLYNEQVAYDTASAITSVQDLVYHSGAGPDVTSYIDSVVTRERDDGPTGWGENAKGPTLWAIASRQFLLQNWRADVVRATDSAGSVTDRIRYSAYGEPVRWSPFDVAGGGVADNAPDGEFDKADHTAFATAFSNGDPQADVNGDGVVNTADETAFTNAWGFFDDGPLGPGTLSRDLDAGFRRGYAGYEFDPVLGAGGASVYHVRNRVYDAENGRWTKRDPLGYVDGPSMYEYCRGMAMEGRDRWGLATSCSDWDDGECETDFSDPICAAKCTSLRPGHTLYGITPYDGLPGVINGCCICLGNIYRDLWPSTPGTPLTPRKVYHHGPPTAGFDQAMSLIVRCVNRHELRHVHQFALPGRPKGDCGECEAYRGEIGCLVLGIEECKTMECEQMLIAQLNSAIDSESHFCGRCNATLPTPT